MVIGMAAFPQGALGWQPAAEERVDAEWQRRVHDRHHLPRRTRIPRVGRKLLAAYRLAAGGGE